MIPAISLLIGLFLGTTGGTVFGLVLAAAARSNRAGDELACEPATGCCTSRTAPASSTGSWSSRNCECDIVDAEIVHLEGCPTHLHPEFDCDCD